MGIKISNLKKDNKSKHVKEEESIWKRELFSFTKPFSNKIKESFYAELSVLLDSGINLKDAIILISEIYAKKKEEKIILSILDNMIAGNQLAEAMERFGCFTKYEVQTIRIGEKTGNLGNVIEKLRDFYKQKNELRRQLISSLSYPLIVLLTAVLVVYFMLSYVVPMFQDIFRQNNVELPWITQKVIYISEIFKGNGLLSLLILLALLLTVKFFQKKERVKYFIDRVKLKIPFLGDYIRKIYLVQFNQAMAFLTNAKIPISEGIDLAKKMTPFHPLKAALSSIERDILQGQKLNTSFGKHRIFDSKMTSLLKVAEETNKTDYIFEKLYHQYSLEVKYKGDLLAKALNFVLTLTVALIVGLILIAMYLPMFKLSSIIG